MATASRSSRRMGLEAVHGAWLLECVGPCRSARLLRGNDVRRRRDRVEVIHQRSAMLQYGALIDRAFIGDLADVERGRLVNQDHSADACGTTGALSRMRVQATLKLLSYTLVTEHVDRSGIYRAPRYVG